MRKNCKPKVYILETHSSRMPDPTIHFVETMKDLIGMMDVQETSSLWRILVTKCRLRDKGSNKQVTR